MLPQFEGLDEWIPRPYREALIAAVDSGAITVERSVISDGIVASDQAREHLAHRWQPTGRLR